jgi:hypothetical protein
LSDRAAASRSVTLSSFGCIVIAFTSTRNCDQAADARGLEVVRKANQQIRPKSLGEPL